jgi:signal transduction histidine kinase/CheY-like chemotaxis protein
MLSTRLNERAKALFEQDQVARFRGTDRLMAALLFVQWVCSICYELIWNRTTWSGSVASPSPHLIETVIGGGLVTIFPIYLCLSHAGTSWSRYSAVVSQILWSAILIHISGGRIEAHFHIFVSLALLSNYRDWKVLPIATAIVVVHHAVLGIYFPQSVFGSANPDRWRWVEHGAWVLFEDAVLAWFCFSGTHEMLEIAGREALLEQTHESIERQVVERTQLLEAAMQEASEANQAKSRFLTNMSHEVRTPLNGIVGSLQLIHSSDVSEEVAEYTQNIESCTYMLGGILNNVLAVSEIENDRLMIRSVEVDFRDIVQEACLGWNEIATAKGVAFQLRQPKKKLLGFGDPRRLRQTVANLVSNAVKFTERGAITVDFEWSKLSADLAEVRIRVADTGPGIASDQLQIIFDSFTQADASSTRAFGGVGIGLYLAEKLAGLMGGELQVESKLGVGSAFTLRLPVALALTISEGHPDGRRKAFAPLHRNAILLGNESFALDKIGQILKQLGATTECAPLKSGHSGTLSLEGSDVVIVDIRQPEDFQWLQQLSVPKTSAVIALVSRDLPEVSRMMLEDSADIILTKPVDIRVLHQAIAALTAYRLAQVA